MDVTLDCERTNAPYLRVHSCIGHTCGHNLPVRTYLACTHYLPVHALIHSLMHALKLTPCLCFHTNPLKPCLCCRAYQCSHLACTLLHIDPFCWCGQIHILSIRAHLTLALFCLASMRTRLVLCTQLPRIAHIPLEFHHLAYALKYRLCVCTLL